MDSGSRLNFTSHTSFSPIGEDEAAAPPLFLHRQAGRACVAIQNVDQAREGMASAPSGPLLGC